MTEDEQKRLDDVLAILHEVQQLDWDGSIDLPDALAGRIDTALGNYRPEDEDEEDLDEDLDEDEDDDEDFDEDEEDEE